MLLKGVTSVIITFLMTMFISLIMFTLGSVNIPQYPTEVAAGLTFIGNLIVGAISFLGYWFTYPILFFSIATIALVLSFDFMYHAGFWVLSKVPIINIRRN